MITRITNAQLNSAAELNHPLEKEGERGIGSLRRWKISDPLSRGNRKAWLLFNHRTR
jgi:hypothetical protein